MLPTVERMIIDPIYFHTFQFSDSFLFAFAVTLLNDTHPMLFSQFMRTLCLFFNSIYKIHKFHRVIVANSLELLHVRVICGLLCAYEIVLSFLFYS